MTRQPHMGGAAPLYLPPGEVEETPLDIIPTIDQEEPVGTYRDWDPAQTRVMVYTTDPGRYPKDLVAVDGAAARAHCEATYGKVLEVKQVPYRYFFRVRRV